jgi:hypothetical protein
MNISFDKFHLAERLLQSKHLVVVLGMYKGYFYAMAASNLSKRGRRIQGRWNSAI